MVTGKEIRIVSLLALDTAFFLLEAIIGYSVHSLALVADSFHMLNDIVSLIIALWAVKVKNTKPADGKYTYGWQRAEILGALINAVFLLALCFTIVMEAIQRFFEPTEINSPKLVLGVGIAGLLSNLVGLVLFHDHGHSHGGGSGGHGHGHSHSHTDEEAEIGDVAQEESDEHHEHEHGHSHSHKLTDDSNRNNSTTDFADYFPENVVQRYDSESTPLIKDKQKPAKKRKSMNMEGVFLHVLGDALGNVGVILTALFIWKTEYTWRYLTDPLVSLLITLIIFSSALPLCRKSSKILLQATPPNVNTNLIIEEIMNLPLIKSVHDFHVWNLNEDILIASLHLELNEDRNGSNISLNDGGNNDQFNKNAFVDAVKQVRSILHRFGIHSATIQPEFSALRQINNDNIGNDHSISHSSLNKKPSAYGATNKQNCAVDDVSGCDNDQCLKIT